MTEHNTDAMPPHNQGWHRTDMPKNGGSTRESGVPARILIMIGLLIPLVVAAWLLLIPGAVNASSNVERDAAIDAMFALCLLGAGAITSLGYVLLDRHIISTAKLLWTLGASASAAVVSWLVGQGLANLSYLCPSDLKQLGSGERVCTLMSADMMPVFAPATVPGAQPITTITMHSYSVLLLWPLLVAITGWVSSALIVMWQRRKISSEARDN